MEIGFIDFHGLWEGRKTAPSFSGLSLNRHFHSPLPLWRMVHADLLICSTMVLLACCMRCAASRLSALMLSPDQPGLTDTRCSQHHLPLRDLVDGVEVVDSVACGAVALVHGIDAQKAGLSVGRGLAPFADLNRRGVGLFVVAQAVARA